MHRILCTNLILRLVESISLSYLNHQPSISIIDTDDDDDDDGMMKHDD